MEAFNPMYNNTRNFTKNNKRRNDSDLSFMKPPFDGWLKELFSGKRKTNVAPPYEKDKVIHSTTFDDANILKPNTNRDFTETEYTMELRVYDKKNNTIIENPTWLYTLLSENNWRGTRDLANNEANAANITDDVNATPWDQQSHDFRTQNPYVWLALPAGDLTTNNAMDRRVRIGFDLFHDYYMDTEDFDLLDRHYTVRTRLRFGSLSGNSEYDRLLIQVKQGAIVSDDGLKEVHKYESRLSPTNGDFPDELLNEILSDTKIGINEWSKYTDPANVTTSNYIAPIQQLYTDLRLIEEIEVILLPMKKTPNIANRDAAVVELKKMQQKPEVLASIDIPELLRYLISELEKAQTDAEVANINYLNTDLKGEKLLPDEKGLTDVLALEEKAFIKSARGRFHLVETSLDSMKLFYEQGKTILTTFQAPMHTYVADESATKSAEIKTLSETIDQLLSAVPTDTKVEDSFNKLFTGFPVGNSPRTAFNNIISAQDTDRRTTTGDADLIPTKEEVDAMDQERIIADRIDAAYQKVADDLSANNNEFYTLIKGANNTGIEAEILKIREAGTAVRGLWFDRAREFYVPGSSRTDSSGGDFIIDTLDVSAMYSGDAYKKTPMVDRTNTSEPDPSKMVGVRVSNDLQIEARREGAYRSKIFSLIDKMTVDAAGNPQLLAKINELKLIIETEGTGSNKITTLMNEIKSLAASNEAIKLDVRLFEGTSFVFDQYKTKLKYMADNKRGSILLKIETMVNDARINRPELKIPECYFKWEPVTVSRGESALDLVRNSKR